MISQSKTETSEAGALSRAPASGRSIQSQITTETITSDGVTPEASHYMREFIFKGKSYDRGQVLLRMFRLIRAEPNGCWRWTGTIYNHGYGAAYIGAHSRSRTAAHRVVYELLVGPVPAGLVLDHLCCNKPCVNPNHLEPVTTAENVRRWAKTVQPKTHCRHGHEFTPENTKTVPHWRASGIAGSTRRVCLQCKRETYPKRYGRREHIPFIKPKSEPRPEGPEGDAGGMHPPKQVRE